MKPKSIVAIGNVPAYELANDEIPTAPMLELYRAQRRIGELEDLLKSRDVKIEKCLELLSSEILFLRTGLHNNLWPTHDELTRRLFKIEGMVKNLLDVCYTGETQPLKTRWGIR